ncbi:MAG: hypothetical protein NC200_07455 [Candidatus Gastranaerophilales bacterium]|nr:hypothetical protein [Candidatus Gastranaerophilales bacterium]
MITYNTVKEIYGRNYGSMQLFKRDYFNQLVYTEGVLDFQKTLNAYWLVDNVISYIPKVLKTFKETEDTFYVIEIALKQDKSGYMEIYHEGYLGDNYHEHISVAYQRIPFIDLPTIVDKEITTYKFYLSLHNYSPIQFMLLLPSE